MAKRMKKQTTAEIRKVLRAALKEDQFVEVRFDFEKRHRLARVIEVSSDFLVYFELETNSMGYEGPNVVRLSSVQGANIESNKREFYTLGPALLGHTKPTIPKIRLTSMATVLTDLDKHYNCVCFDAPSEMRDACWIGHVKSVNRTTLEMSEINPDGRWDEDVSYFPLRAITHVSVNTGYVNALWLVANHLGELEAGAEIDDAAIKPKRKRTAT